MAAMEYESIPPLSPKRETEHEILQIAIDIEEEDSVGLSEGAIETKKPRKNSLQKLQEDADKYGITGIRATMDGHVTRNNLNMVMPFVVEQGNEETCSYVTISKVLVFNLMGLLMDINVSHPERLALHKLMKKLPIESVTLNAYRDLEPYYRTSVKGYVMILFFFYFYDWIKKNDFRPYYLSPSEIPIEYDAKATELFEKRLPLLNKYLKLKIKRLAGITFTGNEWIDKITKDLEPYADRLEWKRTTLCTLLVSTSVGWKKDYSTNIPIFTPHMFEAICNQFILPITNKGMKLILTLCSKERDLHDVMIVGMENNFLLISNSWGHSIDAVPIESLPRINFKNDDTTWFVFQITFLLPVFNDDRKLDELASQYNFYSYPKFHEIMSTYIVPDFTLDPTFTKLDPMSLRITRAGRMKRRKTKRMKRFVKKTNRK